MAAAARPEPAPFGVRRTEPIRVLLADDEPLMLEVVGRLIAAEPTMQLVGCARSASEAIDLATRLGPDVALVDVRMEGGGPRAARAIRSRSPRTQIIGFSAASDRETVLEMLAAGATGYLLKGADAEDILEAIRRTASGRSALSVGVTVEVVGELVARLEAERAGLESRRRLFERIRRVLTERGLSVVFQPIFDLRREAIVGVEALARFPRRPHQAPDAWFDDAERVDLRCELEMAAIRSALARMDDLPSDTFLSINLSPETACSPELMHAVEFAYAPGRLVLEITEHAPVKDYARLNASLRSLRARGVRLAVDDAGSGFASLQHILRLAPDFIKLDMALTRDVDNDLARRALAAALISFASEIGAAIIAEGIETQAELEALRDLGVAYGQGFHLGRPAPMADPAPIRLVREMGRTA